MPEGLKKECRKLVEPSAWTARVHVIGTDKTEEIEGLWHGLIDSVKRERITPEEFTSGLMGFFDELAMIYKNIIRGQEEQRLANIRNLYRFTDIEEYQEELMDFIMELHRRINTQEDKSPNQQKMKQAVEYIRENYSADLNMAVVSNFVSMNYTLFSYEFKQYTGSNFVNYLKALRMEEAKKLLAETDLKVIEISQQVGYENEKHFMKIFKGTYGVSPSEYRRNMSVTPA
ncbi:MAG: AraC family transcriptional regulator [Blautia sp.]|nr:AraC family transcriptional regulator [Blautia sp.]